MGIFDEFIQKRFLGSGGTSAHPKPKPKPKRSSGSGGTEVHEYTRGDGTKVRGYDRKGGKSGLGDRRDAGRLRRRGRREGKRLARKIGVGDVKRFQERHGLEPTGKIDGDTLVALRGARSRQEGGHTPDGWGKRPSPAKFPPDKWNALPDAQKLKLMREFTRRGGKLPGGRKFAEDGSLLVPKKQPGAFRAVGGQKVAKDAMTTGDMGGAGQAPLTVDQGRKRRRKKKEEEEDVAKDAKDVPNLPGKTNWVEEHGHLPKAIAAVAGDLITQRGMTTSHAIATAVSRAKVWCAKGNPKYCAAVAEWEKMKASAGVQKALNLDGEDVVERVMKHFDG